MPAWCPDSATAAELGYARGTVSAHHDRELVPAGDNKAAALDSASELGVAVVVAELLVERVAGWNLGNVCHDFFYDLLCLLVLLRSFVRLFLRQ